MNDMNNDQNRNQQPHTSREDELRTRYESQKQEGKTKLGGAGVLSVIIGVIVGAVLIFLAYSLLQGLGGFLTGLD